MTCPECGAVLAAAQLDIHLYRSHHIYQFRGVRRTFHDTLAALLGAVCAAPPDTDAWKLLEELVAQECGTAADSFLAASLSRGLSRAGADDRDPAITAVAELVVNSSRRQTLVGCMLEDGELAGLCLSLRVLAKVHVPLKSVHLPVLRRLLLDRRLSAEEQLAAAVALLRNMGQTEPDAQGVLRTLIAGRGKQRSIERLRQLEQMVGAHPAIEELCAELEDQVRMRCPRCQVELRRRQMVPHLWQEHRLLLEGRRVRDPWEIVEDWIAAYRRSPNPQLMLRCRSLGQRVHPERGLLHVHRLFLARGIDDAEASRTLLSEAEQQQASLCPQCYALVPIPEELPPAALSVCRGRLSARGYRVEVSERGLVPWLEIETPGQAPLRIRSSDRLLTRKGATLLLVGPLVAAALVLALLGHGLFPLLLMLAAALAVYLFVWRRWQSLPDPMSSAVDQAWTLLAPRLHASGFSLEDSAFLGGLALASTSRGQAAARTDVVEQAIQVTERAVATRVGAARHLGALHRLRVSDAVAAGKDPVPLVVGLIGRCFDGQLPLAFAEGLLAAWRTAWWTKSKLVRLRTLLLNRAFETGFEVRNLLDAGQTAPTLGVVLGTGDPGGLARLRLLWSLRPRRPWESCGEATTAFALATDPEGGEILGKYPDLLLYQPASGLAGVEQTRGAEIVVCGRGIFFEDTLFTEPLRSIEVITKRSAAGESYVLVLGEHRFVFRSSPDPIAAHVEKWFRYYFGEFVPQIAEVYRWKSPHVGAILRAWGTVPCPDCKRTLLPRAGEVAITLSEMSEAALHEQGAK